MKQLTFSQITKLQRTYNVTRMQQMINDGTCWKMEGSSGRFAMNCLESGVCMLPLKPQYGYYSNRVPSRTELKRGSKGTFLNSVNFWNRVMEGDFDDVEWLQETFGCIEKLAV